MGLEFPLFQFLRDRIARVRGIRPRRHYRAGVLGGD